MMMMRFQLVLVAVVCALASLSTAFVMAPPAVTSSVSLDACRRNTKKEKRQRNHENMRKFKRGNAPVARGGGGKKKTLSRKKLTLKAQASKEKERESAFMARLFVATGPAEEKKLDLGVF